ESKSGQRLTLYLRHNDGGTDTAFKFASQNGVEAFYWRDGPFGYALVADLPRDQLMPLAEAVYHQIAE
ncbi:MAG: anti-sigma factor, partial [Rhodospirillaceae bacterium]|nr:anti-sigma factor [Rhodospirillaceae bacterium]